MATVTLAVQDIIPGGLVATYSSVLTTNTYEVRNDGKTLLHVKNGGTVATIVTLVSPGTVGGLAIADKTVSVAAGVDTFIGKLPPGIYNDTGSNVSVSFSIDTLVTAAALRA